MRAAPLLHFRPWRRVSVDPSRLSFLLLPRHRLTIDAQRIGVIKSSRPDDKATAGANTRRRFAAAILTNLTLTTLGRRSSLVSSVYFFTTNSSQITTYPLSCLNAFISANKNRFPLKNQLGWNDFLVLLSIIVAY